MLFYLVNYKYIYLFIDLRVGFRKECYLGVEMMKQNSLFNICSYLLDIILFK